MSPEEIEQMMRLCYRIQVEKDPKIFSELLTELNELVKKKERRLNEKQKKTPDNFFVKKGKG